MRFFAGASLLAIALLSPSPLWAQHWTPQEQEIIDLNQSCWDAWGAQDLAAVRRICNEHPDGRHWVSTESAPGIGWSEKNVERHAAVFNPLEKWLYWEIRPLSVRVFDNVALIHFWATLTTRDDKGVRSTTTKKQLNIWQRINGRWTWIGGMSAPETGT